MNGPDDRQRRVYGRRRGRRLRPGRRRLLEDLLPRVEVVLTRGGGALDPAGLFAGPVADVWLEIGFGGGEHLAAQAGVHPDIGMIGCEPYINGVAALLAHIERDALANVRIFAGDARDLIDALPVASIGRTFVLFPDPWPKSRHAGRRLVAPDTVEALARVMKDRAELRLASDDSGHVRWILEHMLRCPSFCWTAVGPRDWRVRPDDWPATRYEEKALAQGRKCAYLRFVRVDRRDPPG